MPDDRAPTAEERRAVSDRLWVPDNPDGSGWADVDWVSAVRGSRYHYRHGDPFAVADARRPACYRVVTRLESAELAAHENSYYVPARRLADFVGELALAGGAEVIWHVEPCAAPPPEARLGIDVTGGAAQATNRGAGDSPTPRLPTASPEAER